MGYKQTEKLSQTEQSQKNWIFTSAHTWLELIQGHELITFISDNLGEELTRLLIGPLRVNDAHPYCIRNGDGIDLLAVNSAIARLGSAYYYWDAIAHHLYRRTTHILDVFSLFLLPVKTDHNNLILLHRSSIDPTKATAFNLGGDQDLVKSAQRGTIFPIVDNRTHNPLELFATDLGVSEMDGIKINLLFWQQIKLIQSLRSRALNSLAQSSVLPDSLLIHLRQTTWPEGISFPALFRIVRSWQLTEDEQDLLFDALDQKADELYQSLGPINEITACAEQLARAFGIAYHSAIANCPEWVQ